MPSSFWSQPSNKKIITYQCSYSVVTCSYLTYKQTWSPITKIRYNTHVPVRTYIYCTYITTYILMNSKDWYRYRPVRYRTVRYDWLYKMVLYNIVSEGYSMVVKFNIFFCVFKYSYSFDTTNFFWNVSKSLYFVQIRTFGAFG